MKLEANRLQLPAYRLKLPRKVAVERRVAFNSRSKGPYHAGLEKPCRQRG
ncbi:hypothetical protein E2N90_00935 [Pseudomonas syringae pv. tomato]|nr:hypothetical protein EIZ61_08405 [Pseudomonas syringae]TES59629.1 hypothetical protein E2N91_08990 [Pseudomonas syringae pv. tomato]TES70392.1 hypothetical protein E2N90_00935 [Pseudomonas syringae pv. tomato]TES75261.1 hypothetical protein E2N89_21575 [Pseudomonas syringae pv. tomato]